MTFLIDSIHYVFCVSQILKSLLIEIIQKLWINLVVRKDLPRIISSNLMGWLLNCWRLNLRLTSLHAIRREISKQVSRLIVFGNIWLFERIFLAELGFGCTFWLKLVCTFHVNKRSSWLNWLSLRFIFLLNKHFEQIFREC